MKSFFASATETRPLAPNPVSNEPGERPPVVAPAAPPRPTAAKSINPIPPSRVMRQRLQDLRFVRFIPYSERQLLAAEGGRGGIGASRPESRGPFFVGPRTRRNQDEVQARVHLARRLRARSEPAQQDKDCRLRVGADPRPAAAVELRRQLDAPGGRLQLGLLPPAGRALPRPCAQPQPPRHVRGAVAL